MQEVVHHARVERNKVLDVAQQRPVASTGQQRVTGSQAAVAVAVVVVVVVVSKAQHADHSKTPQCARLSKTPI